LCRTLPKCMKRLWKSNHLSLRTASHGDRDSVLSLERSLFDLRRKVSTRISSFNEVLYHVIANK
jgi:hypothetical protein